MTLLIIDMQRDFMPGGALPVPQGDQIVPLINRLMPRFGHIVATQDWHPRDHVSFAENHPGKKVGDTVDVHGVPHILWPTHCVQNTPGAEFASGLVTENIHEIFRKGTDKDIDSYSAFFDNAKKKATGLEKYLREHGATEIYLCGVATDYCVLYSALDALELGFKTHVIADACRGLAKSRAALERMTQKGCKISFSEEFC